MAKKKTEAKSPAKSEATAKKKAAAPAAKKSETKAETKSASSSKSSRPSKPGTTAAMPLVDTDLAAQAAAQMLAAGLGRREQQSEEEKREGWMIRQLKADLNKGHAQVVSNILDKGAPQGGRKSSGQPFGQKQVGRNQTYGADVTRSGVPRRTSG